MLKRLIKVIAIIISIIFVPYLLGVLMEYSFLPTQPESNGVGEWVWGLFSCICLFFIVGVIKEIILPIWEYIINGS